MGSAVTPQGDMPEIAFLIFTTEERSMSRFTNFLTSIVPQFRLCPTGIDVAFFGQKMKEAIMKTFTAVVLAALAIGFGGPGSGIRGRSKLAEGRRSTWQDWLRIARLSANRPEGN